MKDYGISYIPSANQNSKEPSEPIVSDKVDVDKVNELIDKKIGNLNNLNTNLKNNAVNAINELGDKISKLEDTKETMSFKNTKKSNKE
ncbi:hypothetical protein [Campylobacter estrildidarum]|uniref:Uncharacterized protein n=1 Tax=Campylobacter estrildidarum TaxID=2510189 RepID=A0A4U7BEA1_9BACT|nr:hypothetical protein [Campylobacter estrildidarum]TKX29519.1 hypothetical protein CQA69_07405 [Campylobacter estrildidarum]